VNVKKLFIFHDKRPSLFGNIVLRKQLRHLQQLIWGDKIVEFSEDKAIINEFIDKVGYSEAS
jgi:hypothetical protein